MESLDLSPVLPFWVYDILEDQKPGWVDWITGGLGAGKSYGLACWHLAMCYRNLASRFSWSLVPTHSKAELISIPAFQAVLADHYGMLEGKDYTIKGSIPRRLYLKRTNQEIIFHSANKFRSLVGENISHWSATECGYYQHIEWFEKTMARMRCPRAAILAGFGEGTPEGVDNPYADLANFESIDPIRHFRRTVLWTDDNPYLKPDYVLNLERTLAHDPGKLRSYRYGEFVPFTHGTAYWEFFHSRNVKLDVALSDCLPLLFCWDFNRAPLAWVTMQRQPVDTRNGRDYRFVALAESSGKSRGILDACVEFMIACPPEKFRHTPIEIYGDPSGFAGSHLAASCSYDQILQILRQKYDNVTVAASRAAPRVQARLERSNALLAYEKFVIAVWCRNLIRSLSMTALKQGTWDMEKPSRDDWTHYSDATGYPLLQLTKSEDLEALPGSKKISGLNMSL